MRRRRAADIALRGPGPVHRVDLLWYDLETLLAHLVEPWAPLIGLGTPGEQLGAGRLESSDPTWRDQVVQLSAAAQRIFLLPSNRPGTAWELDHIAPRPHLLAKPVFIVPPTTDVRQILDHFNQLDLDQWQPPGQRRTPSRGRQAIADVLRHDRLDAFGPGAHKDDTPQDTSLRDDAIRTLRRLVDTQTHRRLKADVWGTLLMLERPRATTLYRPLTLHETLSLNPADLSPQIKLSTGHLKDALHDAIRSATDA